MNPDKCRVALLEAATNADPDLNDPGLTHELNAALAAFATYRNMLALARIHVLPRGSLERHVPGTGGGKKNAIVAKALQWLRQPSASKVADVRHQYVDLVAIIEALPTRTSVDLESELRAVLADILNILMPALFEERWTESMGRLELLSLFHAEPLRRKFEQLCSVSALHIEGPRKFSAELRVSLAGWRSWRLPFDQDTTEPRMFWLTFQG